MGFAIDRLLDPAVNLTLGTYLSLMALQLVCEWLSETCRWLWGWNWSLSKHERFVTDVVSELRQTR